MTPEALSGTPSAPVTPRVLVFFDYACPFCYLDWPRLRRLRAERGVELVLVPYELRPTLPKEGVPVTELGAAHSDRVEEHMRRMADEGGLELTFPAFMPNTHEALSFGEYARDLGAEVHEHVHEALFTAYNGAGRDIGDRETLARIAGETGIGWEDLRSALDDDRFGERLHQFYHLALSMGITATPAALICNELLIGSRPYEVLAEALERCMVGEASLTHAGHAEVPPAVGDSDGSSQAEGAPPAIHR